MKYKFGETIVSEKHTHSFDSIKLVKVKADNPRYSIAKNGTWSFVTRYCSCGEEKAIDLFPRQHAEAYIEGLLERG